MKILYYTWDDKKYAEELKKEGINVTITNEEDLVIQSINKSNYDMLIFDTISVINYKKLFQYIYKNDINIIPIAITEVNNDFILGEAMELGLIDYIYNTLTPKQFLNKIKALTFLITKEKNDTPGNILKIRDLIYDTKTREAKRQGEEFNLTLKEGKLLELLIRNKNKVVSREDIFENIWNIEETQDKNISDVYITFLRRKIDNKFDDKLIKTIRNVGYMIKD